MNHTTYNQRNALIKDTSHFMSYVPNDFIQPHKQLKNQLTSLQERNLKLKEDTWRNKQKLLGYGDFNNETVQIRSYSSNNNINLSQMNSTYRAPIIVQPPPLNTRVYIPSQKTIQSNQNNMNIDNSQLLRYKSEVERYKLLIVQYEKKIEILSKNQRTYQREIETFKERINKMNFMLQERQVQKQTIITKYTSQIQQLRYGKLVDSRLKQVKQCTNCQSLNNKIKQLTNHITQLTNQLTLRTKKIKQLQQSNKQGIISKMQQQIISLNRVIEHNTTIINQNQENFNREYNQMVNQLNKQQSYVRDYEEKIQSYQNHVSQLNQYLDSLRSENSMLKSKGGLDSSQTNYGEQFKFLQQEVTNLRQHLISAQQKSQQIRKQNINLTHQLSDQKSSFQRTINSLRKEYNQSESQNHNLKLTLQTSKAQYMEINSRYTYIQNEYNILQNKFKNNNQNLNKNSQGSNEELVRLKQENLSLNQQILNFKTQTEVYQKQIRNLNIQMRRSYEALSQLKSKTKAQIVDQSLDQKVKSICKQRQQNYKKQIQSLSFELQHTKKMISQLFSKIQQEGNREPDSELQKQISERYKKHYQQLINKQNNQIDGLNGQIDRLLINIRNLESGDKIENYKKELIVKETHIFQLQNKIKNEQSIFKKYQNDLYQSRKKQEETYKNLENAEVYIQSLQEQLRISKQQGTGVSFSSTQKYQLQSKITQFMNKNAFLSSEVQRLLTLNKQLNDTLKQIQEERMRSSPSKVDKSQWRQLSKTYEQLFKENDALRHSYSVLEKQMNSKTVQLGMLRNQKQIHIQQIEGLKIQFDSKNSKYQNQYNQQVTINQKLQTTIRQLNKILQGLRKTISQQTSRILSLQSQLKNKEDQFGQKYLPRQVNEDKDLIEQLTNFQHIISQLTQQKQDLITHLQSAEKYIFDFQQKNYQQIIRQLEHNITILSEERTALLRRQTQLQRGLHQMDSGRNTPQDEAKINIYLLQIKKLKERIVQLQNTIANLKRINLQLQNKLKISTTTQRDNINYKQKIQVLQKDKERVIHEMNKVKQHLQRSPLPVKQVDPRLEEFIRRNHEIMEELAHAKLYISELEEKCEVYIRNSHHTSNSYQVKTQINTNMKTTGFGQTSTYPIDSMQHTSTNSFGQGDSKKTEELQLIISRLSSQKDQLSTQIKLIQNEKSSLQNNYKQNIKKIQNHNATVLNQQKSSFTRSIHEYEIKIKRISQEGRILENEIKNIRNSSVNSQEMQILTQKNRKLENDKAVISSQLERLTQVITNLNKQKVNYDNLLKQESSKIQKKYSQENLRLHNTINEHVITIQRLQLQNTRLNTQFNSTQQHTQDVQLNSQISKMSIIIKQKDQQIKDILQHLKQAQAYIGTHQPQFLAWQVQKEHVFVTLREYELQIKTLLQENQNLLKRQPLSEGVDNIQKYNQSLKVIENLQKQILIKDNKNKELQSNYSVINIQLNNLKIEQTKWKNERQSINLIKTTNQKLLLERQQVQKALNELQGQNKKLSTTNAHLFQENKTISLKISQKQNEQQDIKIKTQKAIMASQIQRLSNQLLKISKQKDDLQRNYRLINSENSQLKTKNNQITTIQEQYKKLVNEVNVYKSQKAIQSKDTNRQLELEQLNNQKLYILSKLRQAEDYIFKLEQESQTIRPNLQASELQKQLKQVKLQKQQILRKLLQSQSFLKNYEQVIKSQEQNGKKNSMLQNTIKQVKNEVLQLQKKLQKAENTIRQLQQSIRQYQIKVQGVTNLQNQIITFKIQKLELLNKLKQAQAQISNLNSVTTFNNKEELTPKISQLQEKNSNTVTRLTEENINLKKQINTFIEQINAAKETFQRLAEQNKKLKRQSKILIEQMTASKETFGKLIEQNKNLKRQSNILIEQVSAAKSTFQNLMIQNLGTKKQSNLNTGQIHADRQALRKLTEQNMSLKRQVSTLIEQMNSAKETFKKLTEKNTKSERQSSTLIEQMNAAKETFKKIIEQNNKLKRQSNTLMEQMSAAKETFQKLTVQNLNSKRQSSTLIEQMNAAKQTNVTLGQKLMQAQNYIIYLQQNNEIIIQKIVQPIQKEIEQFKLEREQLIKKIIEAEEEIVRLQNLSTSSELPQNNEAQLMRRISQLQQENRKSSQKIYKLSQQNSGILSKLHESQSFIQTLPKDTSYTSQEKIRNLKLQLQRLSEQNNINKSKLQQAEQYIEKCQKHKDQISEKLAISQLNIKNLYEQYSLKEGEYHHSDQEHDAHLQQSPNKQTQLLQTLQNSRLKLHQKGHLSNTVTRLTEENINLKKQINTFIEQINAAKETFQRLTEQNKKLKRQSNILIEQMTASKETFGKLIEQNKNLKRQSNILIEQVSAAKSTFQNLMIQNMGTKKQSNLNTGQINTDRQALRKLTEQNMSLKRQVNTLIEQMNAAKETFKKLTEKNTKSERQQSTLIEQMNAAKETFKKLTEQNSQLKRRTITLVEQINAAKQSFQNLTVQNINLKRQSNTLIQQINAAKESFKKLTQKNTKSERQSSTLIEQMNAAKETFKKLIEQNNKLKRQSNTLIQQINAAKESFKKLTQTKSERQSSTLVEQLNAAKENFKKLIEQNNKLKRQSSTLMEQMSAAKETFKKLTEKNANSKRQSSTLIEQMNAAKETFKKLIEQNSSLKRQTNTLVQQMSAAKENFLKLVEQNTSLNKQKNTLIEQITAAKQTSQNSITQNKQLQHIIYRLQNQNQDLIARNMLFASEIQRLSYQNQSSKSTLTQTQTELLKTQIENLRVMNESLKKQQVSLYSAIAQNDQILKEVITLRKQKEELTQSCVHADAHIVNLQKENRRKQAKLAQFLIQIQSAQGLKSQIQELLSYKQKIQKEKKFFQQKLYSAEAYINQILIQKEELLKKIKQLGLEIDSLKEIKNNSLQQSSIQLTKQKLQKQTLQKNLSESNEKMRYISSQLQRLKSLLTQSEQKSSIYSKRNFEDAKKIMQMQKELKNQKEIQEDLKQAIEQLSKPKQDENVVLLTQQNNILKETNEKLINQLQQKPKIQQKLKEAQQFIKKLQGELAGQDQKIIQIQKHFDQSTQTNVLIQIQLNNEKKQNKKLSEEIINKQNEITKISNKIAHLQQLVLAGQEQGKLRTVYETQINEMRSRITQLQTLLRKETETKNNLAADNNVQNQIISNLSNVQNQNLQLLNQKETEVQKLKNILAQKQQAIQYEIKEADRKVKQINAEYDQTRKKLSQSNQELLRVNPLLQEIQGQKQRLSNELKDLENIIKVQKQQIYQISAKLQEAEQYIRHLQSENAKLNNPILKSSINSSSSLQQKGTESQGEISNISVDLKELQSKLIAKEEELINSNQELVLIRQKLNSLQNRINDDDSIDNSHQITLLNDRLKYNQEELLQEKIRNQNLTQINQILENQNTNLKQSLEQFTNQIQQLKNTSKYYELRMMQAEQSLKKSGSQANIQKSSSDQNLEKIDNELQVPKDNKSQQSVGSEDKERQQEYLRLKLLQKQQLIDKLKQTIQNLTEELGEKLTDQENNEMMKNQNTKQLVEQIKKLKQKLDTTQVYVKELQNVRDELSQLGSKSSKSSTERLVKEEQIVSSQKPNTNDDDKILRLVQKLIDYINQYDSLDMFKQENIQKELKGSQIFSQLFETIKMKLMLLNALDVEKQTRLQNKQQEINSLNQQMQKIKKQFDQLLNKAAEADVISQRYQEVLGEVIQYQRLNKNLEDEINNLNNQLSIHKSQLDEFSKQIQNNSSSLSSQLSPRQVPINDQQLKQENHQLRKKLQDAEYELLSIKSSVEGYMNGELIVSPKRKDQGYNFQLFLRECLDNIQRIENNIADVQKQLNQNKQNVQRLIHILKSTDRLGSKRSDESNIVQKLQDLQEKLLLNDRRLKQHQEQSQVQIINLMKQTLSNSQNELNKSKIEDYLNQLQHNIYRNNEEHQQQIQKIKYYYENLQENKSPRVNKEVSDLKSSSKNDKLQKSQNRKDEQGLTEQDRKNFDNEDLLRQINGLTNHIQIYHQEAARMKDKFKKTIEGLVRQIEQMKQAYDSFDKQNPTVKETNPLLNVKVNEIMQKVHFILQNDVKQADQKSDYYADDDYIMTNNYVQYIKSKDQAQQEKEFLHNIKSIADEFQNKESSSLPNLSQNPNILNFSNLSNNDIMSKPFLEYIINNRDLDKEEVNLLKKKINEMKAKQVKENLNYLKENQNKVQELMKKKNELFTAQNILPNTQYRELIFNTMANNFSKDEISQIFGSEDNDELLNKLNEVLGMDGQSSSYIKNQNSSQMMKQIEIIKNRYYKEPSQLSQEVYQHLIKLLSAKDDSEFYMLIDSMFKLIFQLQEQYEKTIAQKDQLYRIHTEKMNKIFNRSSSDESQDYRTLLMEEQAFNVNKEERIHLSESKIKDGMNQLQVQIEKANNQLNN